MGSAVFPAPDGSHHNATGQVKINSDGEIVTIQVMAGWRSVCIATQLTDEIKDQWLAVADDIVFADQAAAHEASCAECAATSSYPLPPNLHLVE